MKAIVIREPGCVALEEKAIPEPQPGFVRVRVKAAAICATDLEVIDGNIPANYPITPGHEWSGIVDAAGSREDESWIGKRVVGSNDVVCLKCDACRSGNWRYCSEFEEIGFRRDGAYAEYVIVPAYGLCELPEQVSFVHGALCEPLGVALGTLEKAGARLGDTLTIIGAGSIGLCILAAAKAMGMREIVVAAATRRRLAIAEQMGAAYTVATAEQNLLEEMKKLLDGKDGTVKEVRKTSKKKQAPLLYDLTELQREANKRFHYSAKETLNIMQRLYENHKVLTYPRTDSRYLTGDILPTIKERLKACGVGPYKKLAGALVNRPLPDKPFFVNNAKVSDHHAIIPTEQFVQLEHMTIDERRIYDLVVRRFLAVLYPAYCYEQVNLTVFVGNALFTARGVVVKDPGWKAVYQEGKESWEEDEDWDEEKEGYSSSAGGREEAEAVPKSQQLPALQAGDVLQGLAICLTEGKTKPPAHFNEASLLSAMENPTAYLQTRDKAMEKTLGETGGLGTVATRADIIEKLFSSFLLEKRGTDILLTSKGKQLLELVPEDLKKPELTADWEMKLSRIARGGLKRNMFMKDIRGYSKELIGQIKQGEGSFRHDNLTNTKCPNCGKRMLAVKGKNSEMLVCQDRACGYRETISRTSNARCPNCHKKMELRGKGDKQIFVCACGYKEKLAAFQERRKREGAGVTKKDVAQYMNRQKKEAMEPLNNALAQALAGLKMDTDH